MNTNEIILLVWDTLENFSQNTTQDQLGFSNGIQGVYKSVIRVDDNTFENEFSKIHDREKLIFICHVSQTKSFDTYSSFINSSTKKNYKGLNTIFVSKGNSGEVMKKLHEDNDVVEKIITYRSLKDNIKMEEIIPRSKKELIGSSEIRLKNEDENSISNKYPIIDYAIITALYDDEFEEVKRVFDFKDEDIIRTNKQEYHVGYLKTNSNIKVVAAIPNATGMVDSAIIATQMLEFFKPKYLLMSGVCGGSSDLSFGDIVVAKQIYTFQKGKISNIKSLDKEGKKVDLNLYDKDNNLVDYNHLYDHNDNQIAISIEKFEIEQDSMINLDPIIKSKVERKRIDIKDKINEGLKEQVTPLRNSINILIEPMACSTMVINKDGYFEDNIRTVNRKTAAVEMESYGVARACEFANNGNTKHIIFKSVMDNMRDKDDEAKKFAAYTSAQFMKHLLEFNILE